jgi:Tol biopolymer transport system component
VTINVWSLPLTGHRTPTQLTFDAIPKSSPAVSPDGRYLAYHSSQSGSEDTYLLHMATGRETALTTSPANESHASFMTGGSQIVYAQYQTETNAPAYRLFKLFSHPTNGGLPKLVTDAGIGRFDQVSDDGRYVLSHSGPEPVAQVLDLRDKTVAVVLRSSHGRIFQPRISRDGQWITFLLRLDDTRTRLYAAPFRGMQLIPESEWMPLAAGDGGEDKPRLSPDNRRLYFTSEIDGYRCIWVQDLDPATLRPIGEPKPFHHFHSARRSLGRVLLNLQEVDIGGDRLTFNMAETTGNLWLLQPVRH